MTTYALNEKLNGVEITFAKKPASEVIAKLKELGFRWHNKNKLWYAKQTDERIALAKKLAEIDNEPVNEPVNVVADKADEPQVADTTDGIDFSDWGGEHSKGYMGAVRWDGSKSNLHLYGTELSKAIRADLKAHGIKGVTIKCHSYANGQSYVVTVTPTDADIVSIDDYSGDKTMYESLRTMDDVSYVLKEDRLPYTGEFIGKLKRIKQCMDAYRYDDTNAMVDYFNTNFYYGIHVK